MPDNAPRVWGRAARQYYKAIIRCEWPVRNPLSPRLTMFMLIAHSLIRYLILLLGVGVTVYALRGVVTRSPYDNRMRVLGGVFALSVHLNLLVGLAALFGRPFQPYVMGHIIPMVFAAVVAQIVPSVMKTRPMEARTHAPHLVSAVVAMALLIWGILALPGGTVLGSYIP